MGTLFQNVQKMADDKLFWIFILLVLLDFSTGYAKAIVWKVTSSDVGTKGVIKHTFTVLFYFFVLLFGYMFKVEHMAQLVFIPVLLTYFTSILENLAVMGIYTPPFLKAKVEQEIKKYNDLLNNELQKTSLDKKQDKGQAPEFNKE